MIITDAFLGEHAVLHAMFAHIDKSLADASFAELKSQGALLAAALASHAALEEELLFTQLEPEIGPQGPLAVMRHEHEVIENSLDKLEGVENQDAARQLLSHTVTTARSHFMKEEQILFPIAISTLSTAILSELGNRWAQARELQV
jgi:hemerythrin-like domain-containing protein